MTEFKYINSTKIQELSKFCSLEEIIKTYEISCEEIFPLMEKAIEEKKIDSLRHQVHSLKSSSFSLGMDPIGTISTNLEKEKNWNVIKKGYEEIKTLYPLCVEEFTQLQREK